MYRRIIYFFIIIIAVFVLSFITREFVNRKSTSYSDVRCVYREYRINKDDIQTAGASRVNFELYGGLIVDPDGEIPHGRFYVSRYDDHVAIFNSNGSLYRQTSIVVDSLTPEIRKLLNKHVYYNELKQLNRFLDSL